jgi:hypothetical protein
MGDERGSVRVSGSNSVDHNHNDDQGRQLDIYPLSCYYFGSKEAIPLKDETLADRVQRLKSKYYFFFSSFLNWLPSIFNDFYLFCFKMLTFLFFLVCVCDCLNVSYAAYGLRTCVEAVILVGSLTSFNILFYFILFLNFFFMKWQLFGIVMGLDTTKLFLGFYMNNVFLIGILVHETCVQLRSSCSNILIYSCCKFEIASLSFLEVA